MALRTTRDALSRIFYQRCFWLFCALIIMIGAVSFAPMTDRGRLFLNLVNMFVLISTVAAVGRTMLSFVIALLLAAPAVWFQYIGLWHDEENGEVVFDVSQRVDTLEEATALGEERNQQEIWDVANGVGIPTGGTGDRENE